ncbi:hypothetical protein [Streptomyces nanshensis]|uniref:Uncharacterized protein n=1 Tax=Streptomyces nanshensis TaxID=518642 RepID=A0A1E7LCZ9_9ACTN|nr:hypothetical protein [Streptomyces nanshensis]OEV14076.1 hypothetical protein AN218_00965 [Streptomyces nanshensis]
MKHFLVGAALGLLAAGITYAISPTPWWWTVGMIVAGGIWLRKLPTAEEFVRSWRADRDHAVTPERR